MVDSVLRLFMLRFAPARPGRRKVAQFFGASIDAAERDVGEADDPVAGECLSNADGLADHGLTDEDQFATPFDGAVGTHTAHSVITLVARFLDAIGIGSRGRRVSAG